MASLVERYTRWLSAMNKRLTREKRAVLETIALLRRAFTLEALMDGITQFATPFRISRATVYRTISELQQVRFIGKLNPDNPVQQQFIVLDAPTNT